MRPFFVRVVGAVLLAGVAVAAHGQDYILRPGPRGFDPRMNRYGATEERPAPATVDDEPADPSRTNVRIELLTAGNGGAAVKAQEWSRTLSGLGYSARIRRPLLDDRPEVSERTQGPLRFVSIVGEIDRRGNLVLGDRVFAASEVAELKDWLAEIKKYGAQGSPENRPLWGLSRAQFDDVYAGLSQTVTGDVAGKPLDEAIEQLGLPIEHPVVFNATARERREHPDARIGVSRSVAGLTSGTALAFVLNEYGLGFQPERTPDGGIVLSVRPLPIAKDRKTADPAAPQFWPVGWELEGPSESSTPVAENSTRLPDRKQIAPGLFQLKNFAFADSPLTEVLAAAETEGKVPVLVDRAGLDSAGIDLDKCRVQLDPRPSSWSLALRYATYPHRLGTDLRRDEAGNPLVWVSPAR
jgi:hypothetical protein